jgi:hypothetical protein
LRVFYPGTDKWADEIFMAYYVGRFMGEVAKAGKAELNIPMYANAWLGPQPGQDLPGNYPSGGPVSRVMDVYRAAAPSLDLMAPDIYVPDFKGTCALYARSGNPLFIPEARDQVGNLFWALGRNAAWGWSPFGVEDLNPEGQVAQAYKLLIEMLPALAEWQAAGKVSAILTAEGEKPELISMGGYKITLAKGRMQGSAQSPTSAPGAELPGNVAMGSRAMVNDMRPFALVVNTAPDEFLFIGANGDPTFAVDSPGPARVTIAAKDEGRFEKGRWVPGRRINGDELFQAGLPSPGIGVLKVQLIRFE